MTDPVDPLHVPSQYVRGYRRAGGVLYSRGRTSASSPPPPPPPLLKHYDIAKYRLTFSGPPPVGGGGGGGGGGSWSTLVVGQYFPNDGKFNPAGYYHPLTGVQATIGLNCGVNLDEIPATGLVLVTTNQTFSGNGTQANPIIVVNQRFRCKVTVTGTWYLFRNCEFEGNPTSNGELVTHFANVMHNTVFEQCTFSPSTPYSNTCAIKGWRFTLRRCLFENVIDGIAHVASGSAYTGVDMNVYMEACFIGDSAMVSPDPGAAGGFTDNSGHVDAGMQIRGGNNFAIRGCTIMGFVSEELGVGDAGVPTIRLSNGWRITGIKYPGPNPKWPGVVNVDGTKGQNQWRVGTSVLTMFSPTLGEVSNWVIETTLWDGGAVGVNDNLNSIGGTGIVFRNNLMGRLGQRDRWGAFILMDTRQAASITGNLDGRTVIGTPGQATRHPAYNSRTAAG